MSWQYSWYLSEPSAPNMPLPMISEKPMMALSGVRSSWLILARNFDLAWLASSARFFSRAYFSARSASSIACRSSSACERCRSIDGGAQAQVVVDQLLLVLLDAGDVGADRDVAAVLGAALADVQPAAVLELRLEGARARRLACRSPAGGCGPPACCRPRSRSHRRCRGSRRSPAACAGAGSASCRARGGPRRPTARRLPEWSRSRRAAANRLRRSSRRGSSAR